VCGAEPATPRWHPTDIAVDPRPGELAQLYESAASAQCACDAICLGVRTPLRDATNITAVSPAPATPSALKTITHQGSSSARQSHSSASPGAAAFPASTYQAAGSGLLPLAGSPALHRSFSQNDMSRLSFGGGPGSSTTMQQQPRQHGFGLNGSRTNGGGHYDDGRSTHQQGGRNDYTHDRSPVAPWQASPMGPPPAGSQYNVSASSDGRVVYQQPSTPDRFGPSAGLPWSGGSPGFTPSRNGSAQGHFNGGGNSYNAYHPGGGLNYGYFDQQQGFAPSSQYQYGAGQQRQPFNGARGAAAPYQRRP
jgi:hypothetical protein